MESNLVCYQYQCPNHPRCALAGGTCCAIEPDHRKTTVSEEMCSDEKGWPLFSPNAREQLKFWMKNPMAQFKGIQSE